MSNNTALLCCTNKEECCGPSNPGPVVGNWYFPSGMIVGSLSDNTGVSSYFARNRGLRLVRLYRVGSPQERGRFHCEVPIADGSNQTIYVNICECYLII